MFRNNTIRMHFIRNFIVALLIPITISGILQSLILYQVNYKNVIDRTENTMTKANSYFNLVVQNTENLANVISYNSSLQKVLADNIVLNEASENYTYWKEARDILISNFIPYDNMFSNAAVFNNSGKIVMSLFRYNDNCNFDDYKWNSSIKGSYGTGIWIASHIDPNDYNSGMEHVITLAKKIRMVSSNQVGDDIGYLVINLKESELDKLLNNFVLSGDNTFFLQDENGKIVIHNDSRQIGQPSNIKLLSKTTGSYFSNVDGKNVLVSYCKNTKTGWSLIDFLSTSTIFADSLYYLISTLVIFFTLLIVSIFLSFRMSRKISKPIKELQSHMELVEQGVFSIEFIKESNIYEIDKLVKRFGIMVRRLNSLIEEVYKSNLKEKELEAAVNLAELTSLQQQINPHFLYNTLDSINWIASLGGNEEVSKMVTALSDFFRSSINRGVSFVTVASELSNVQNYIYLQQIRFGSSLTVQMDIQPEVENYLTMKLLLQPIVENAMLHGIQAKCGGGMITIRIFKENDSITFIVSDNGVGMNQATIDKIMSPDIKEKNIGLRNVIQRLSLFFHDKYKFRIDSHIDKGTTVTVTTPCFFREEELNVSDRD